MSSFDIIKMLKRPVVREIETSAHALIAEQNPLDLNVASVIGAAVFMVMRNRLLTSSQNVEGALFWLYRVLQESPRQSPDHEAIVQRQLRDEYGDVWLRLEYFLRLPRTGPAELARLQQKDLIPALQYLKTLGRFEEELKDYKGDMKEECFVLGVCVGLNRDLRMQVEVPMSLLSVLSNMGP